ncbi:unnamed protein product, partial [Arabidopsis halleri]
MENLNFDTLPEDLQKEILSRCIPLETLGVCLCVSKQWRSLIRSREFEDLYLSRWLTADNDVVLLLFDLLLP